MNTIVANPPVTAQFDRIRGLERCLERIEAEYKTLGHDLRRLRRLVEGIGRECPCPAGMDGGETCKFCGKKWEY